MACCLLASSFVGAVRRSAQSPSEPRLTPPTAVVRTPAFEAQMRSGKDLFEHSRFTEAAEIFQSAYHSAQSLSHPGLAGRALGNWAGCQFALHQYQTALRSFLDAHRLSEVAGDTSASTVWEADMAALYLEMGEYDAAAQWIEQSMRRMMPADRVKHLPQLQIQLATMRARAGHLPEAVGLFQQGIEGADQAGDLNLYAIGLNRLGEEYLAEGDLRHAEAALLESYRTRKLHGLPLDVPYRSLGRLRLAQGDLTSASTLLDRAVELAERPGRLTPTWGTYYSRGQVRLAQGRLREALDDLRIALRLGRAWRWSAPADDTARVAEEGMLDRVYTAFIEVGNRLYLETGDAELLQETFAASEENRAASLRALLRDPKSAPPELPANYWEALSRLQKAEVAALQNGAVAGLDKARADLVRLEASLGSDLRPLPPNLVRAAAAALDNNQALFSFHLGSAISWVWALDRAGLAVYALPARGVIESQVQEVARAVRDGRPGANASAAVLYQMLLGPVAPRFQHARHWLLELDDALFGAPIAALIEKMDPRPVYVIERHTLELIPGAAYWLDSAAQPPEQLAPVFLGLGDPIYNQMDTRLARAGSHHADALFLPRLVGSGAEIDSCARAWGGRSVLLRGGDASRQKLEEQLQSHPAAVHLATHYLESAGRRGDGLIALSLSPAGSTELLTSYEISRWHIQTGLVVLSGCHSAAGTALPGTGAAGLTRAWLAAGAQAVVASLWNVPDDEGELFEPLYRNLRSANRLDAPGALREAQLEMLRSGSRLASPGYWGAYFVVGTRGKALLLH